jgi:hypothetical protein
MKAGHLGLRWAMLWAGKMVAASERLRVEQRAGLWVSLKVDGKDLRWVVPLADGWVAR